MNVTLDLFKDNFYKRSGGGTTVLLVVGHAQVCLRGALRTHRKARALITLSAQLPDEVVITKSGFRFPPLLRILFSVGLYLSDETSSTI